MTGGQNLVIANTEIAHEGKAASASSCCCCCCCNSQQRQGKKRI